MYFPSINKENYEKFSEIYFDDFNEYPNQLSFLSYDLVGLVYFLSFKIILSLMKRFFQKKLNSKEK